MLRVRCRAFVATTLRAAQPSSVASDKKGVSSALEGGLARDPDLANARGDPAWRSSSSPR